MQHVLSHLAQQVTANASQIPRIVNKYGIINKSELLVRISQIQRNYLFTIPVEFTFTFAWPLRFFVFFLSFPSPYARTI